MLATGSIDTVPSVDMRRQKQVDQHVSAASPLQSVGPWLGLVVFPIVGLILMTVYGKDVGMLFWAAYIFPICAKIIERMG